ncbi:MAG: YjjG family noncanonical pyrimidine nucleotidase [Bacteroidetes bacterium]|nr:YjjG family noncanonical pyrimidine nucleotidase [Bacteroidota bacterium]
MKKYSHIFFDLDNTLWDFDRNSSETLYELYEKYKLADLGIKSPEHFIGKYQERNAMMWEQYRLGKIDKDTLRNKRFEFTFWDLGIEAVEKISAQMSDDYVSAAPKRNHLFPDAFEVLEYLHEKYVLHIITNGFHEAQFVKLDGTGIRKFFRNIIISEHVGYKKPDVNIFYYAVDSAKTKAEECIMIGDGLEVDVLGAQNAGWDAIYFNPKRIGHSEIITHEIAALAELKDIL